MQSLIYFLPESQEPLPVQRLHCSWSIIDQILSEQFDQTNNFRFSLQISLKPYKSTNNINYFNIIHNCSYAFIRMSVFIVLVKIVNLAKSEWQEENLRDCPLPQTNVVILSKFIITLNDIKCCLFGQQITWQ